MLNKYIVLSLILIVAACNNKEPQIARWQSDAGEAFPQAPASLGGKLVVKNNCLIIEGEKSGDSILVLPYDQAKSQDPAKRFYWDSQQQALVSGGNSFKSGDTIYINGEHLQNLQVLFDKSPEAALPECGINDVTVAFSVSKEPKK